MKSKGLILATAAAGLILGGGMARAAEHEKAGGDMVSCAGINACKGQGTCAGAGSACAGQNACKGQGVVKATKDDCAKKGGKVVESKH